MYLLDTNILSDFMKRKPSEILKNKINQVPIADQFTSSITLGELVFGVKKRRSEELLQRMRRIMQDMEVLPFDAAAAEVYGAIRAELEMNGTPIGEPDIQIAAIALGRGLTVVTANIKHFSRVHGLKVENWLSP